MENIKHIQINSIVNVQAYKADGTLYRQWNGAKVLEISPEEIVLFMYKAKVAERNGQKWVVREPIIWYLSREIFYNTTGMIRRSGIHYYTNLASPAIIENQTIKFIDYDIDIKAYPNDKVRIVDRKEFKKHISKYSYSQKLVRKIKKTTLFLTKLISDSEGFFDEDVIDTYIKELVLSKDLPKKFLKLKFD